MLPLTLKLWIDGQVLVQAYSLRVEPLNLTTSYFNLLLFTQKMKVNLVTTSFNNVSNTVCYCPFFRAITTMLVIYCVSFYLLRYHIYQLTKEYSKHRVDNERRCTLYIVGVTVCIYNFILTSVNINSQYVQILR